MMKPSLQLRIGQQLTMTPQLQQAIRLLQLPTVELQAQVLQALESNVMLESDEEWEQEIQPPSAATLSQGVSDGVLVPVSYRQRREDASFCIQHALEPSSLTYVFRRPDGKELSAEEAAFDPAFHLEWNDDEIEDSEPSRWVIESSDN